MKKTAHLKRQKGFTVVELLIVVVMTSILSIIIFDMGYQYLKQAAALNAKSNFFIERLNLSDFLRTNVGLSTGLINQNSIDDNNVLVPDPADLTGKHWKHLHAVPGAFGSVPVSKTAPAVYTPILYYTQNALDSSGDVIMNGANPYANEYILYLYQTYDVQELRVRTLANAAATGNTATTTCTTATVGCPKDKVLISGVSSMEMRYFSRSGNDIDYRDTCSPASFNCAGNVPPGCNQAEPYDGCSGLDLSQVEVAQFKVKVKKRIESDVNNSFYNSTIIRIALRNA